MYTIVLLTCLTIAIPAWAGSCISTRKALCIPLLSIEEREEMEDQFNEAVFNAKIALVKSLLQQHICTDTALQYTFMYVKKKPFSWKWLKIRYIQKLLLRYEEERLGYRYFD